jgi:hypothetical protein
MEILDREEFNPPALVTNTDAATLFDMLQQMNRMNTLDDSSDDSQIFSRLSERESSNLYRGSGLIRKLIHKYPDESNNIGYRVKDGKGNIVDENNPILLNAVYDALIFSRIYSRCYIYLDFDSNDLQPIKKDEQLSGYKIYHDIFKTGDYYDVGTFKVHYTRIIDVVCNRSYDKFILTTDDINYCDSFIQQFYNSFMNYKKNNLYVNYILENISYLTLGIENLNNLQKSETQKQTLWSKLFDFNINRKINRLLTYDKRTEELNFVSQTFSGVNEAIDISKEFLLAECDYPSDVIFETSSGGNKLGSGVQNQLVARYLWQKRATVWTIKNVLPYYRIFYHRVRKGEKLVVEIPFEVEMTDDEKADFELKGSERTKNLIETGVISNIEARTGYREGEYTLNIELKDDNLLDVQSLDKDEQDEKNTQSPASENKDAENIPSDEFFNDMSIIDSDYLTNLGDEILE